MALFNSINISECGKILEKGELVRFMTKEGIKRIKISGECFEIELR